MWLDHTITVRPKKVEIKQDTFEIISDYIEAGTYFAIGAWADNSELIINNMNVDDLSAMYNIASKIWINFKILDKHSIRVDSYNKPNYRAVKLEVRIFPWFPSDLQSIFWALATQFDWITKIFETHKNWHNYETNTMIMSDIIGKYFDRDNMEYQEKDNMAIYPKETFCSFKDLSDEVYTQHLMLGSWG